MAKASSSFTCRVYYSLLALCYLEVLLWTSCLVASFACTPAVGILDSHQYLLRETGNLNLAVCQSNHFLPGAVDYRGYDLQRQQELIALQRLNDAQLASAPLHLQPQALSALVWLAAAVSGVPAPYTGIKAIQ